ncbi:MAG: T9SS type A sorting domain-containing protein [Chitinophagaceae bacterium]
MKKIILSIIILLNFTLSKAQQVSYTVLSQPTCVPGCDGVIKVVSTFGTPPYTLSITPSFLTTISNDTISGLCAGTSYIITSADAGTSTATSTIYLPASNLSIVNPIVNPDTCNQCVGSLSMQVIGGTPPYTYTILPITASITWLNNAFYGLCGNTTYTVSLVDAMGCFANSVFQIINTSSLSGISVSSTSYDASCNMSADGAIDLNPLPSTGLSYQWSNGDTTQDITNVVNGIYTVHITNSNGDCLYYTDTIDVMGINCGTISGNIYYDSVSNCIFDMGDYYIPNRHLFLSTGAQTITDMNGYYQFSNVPYGSHTITQAQSAYVYQNTCVQPNLVSINATSNNSTNNNFIDTVSALFDESIYLSGSNVVPGFSGSHLNINVSNPNPFTVQNRITLLLNDSLSYSSCNILPDSILSTPNGDSIIWYVTTMPFSNYQYLKVFVNVPSNVTLGSVLTSHVTLMPTNIIDSNLSNNTFFYGQVVVSSWDPNDKQVYPKGIGSEGYITLQDSILTYQIRFQNTGTSVAHNIVILDTLSDKLHISSLEVIGYSHQYQIEILDGHILKFKFNNIMLPDSGSNFEASNGFIVYKIKQKNSNQIGDIISNSASIYFDFNSPVLTNTTINTLKNPTTISESIATDELFKIYPNPASTSVTVEYSLQSETSILQLFDLTGRIVKEITLPKGTSKTEFRVTDLVTGVYTYKQILHDRSAKTGKLLIE